MMNDEGGNNMFWLRLMLIADRLAAWVLLVVVLAYGVTGYGMTKGLISPDLSRAWHLGWLGGIGLAAFVVHTSWAVHLALKRHGIWNAFSKIILMAAYILLASFFVWVNFFYQGGNSSRAAIDTSASTSSMVFTAQTLKDYDGLSGQPAYVAVDGVVYDMSRVFRNGNHHGYGAGLDLSSAFHKEHPDSFLNGYQIVGSYQK